MPGENAVPFARPESWVRKRAGFLNAHVWVTPFSPAEMYPAGDYPNQSRGGDGLTEMDRRRPLHRESGRGALVHHGNHAQSAAGGLAGDARACRWFQADAVGLLPAQSRDGSAAGRPLTVSGRRRRVLHRRHSGIAVNSKHCVSRDSVTPLPSMPSLLRRATGAMRPAHEATGLRRRAPSFDCLGQSAGKTGLLACHRHVTNVA